MKFEDYFNQAWDEHAKDSAKVAAEFRTAILSIENNEQLNQFVGLVTHVMGEHLGLWSEGAALLLDLRRHPAFQDGTETDKTIARSLAVLQIGGGVNSNLKDFSSSDQIRILAVAAAALMEKDCTKARQLLLQSLELAKQGLDVKDPANRALAVTANNLASSMEEKTHRSTQETEMMILAAQIARKYWEIAGTWLQVSRAEYRLAQTYRHAGDLPRAFQHAQTCIQLCIDNKASDLDLFFGHEILALIEKARGNSLAYEQAKNIAKTYFHKMSPENQAWCKSSLDRLN